ncbi:MAG TPA: hypothetical protein VL651_09720 [Bacteroidia bacterium]|jgi:hypothetical protein|nr:hypothetical protein [Bacteroidia bacterium]
MAFDFDRYKVQKRKTAQQTFSVKKFQLSEEKQAELFSIIPG